MGPPLRSSSGDEPRHCTGLRQSYNLWVRKNHHFSRTCPREAGCCRPSGEAVESLSAGCARDNGVTGVVGALRPIADESAPTRGNPDASRHLR